MLSDSRCWVIRVYSDADGIVDFNLNLAPNIQFLHLQNINANLTGYGKSWPWLLRFLSGLRNGNRLEVIELGVCFPCKRDKAATMASWGDIDSILAGPGFPFLREVGVKIHPRWGPWGHDMDPWEKLCADIVRGFPLLTGRGVLVNPH